MPSRSPAIVRTPSASHSIVSARARLALLSAILSLPLTDTFAQTAVASARVNPNDEVVVLDKLEIAEKADANAPLNADGALRALSNTAGSVSVIDSGKVEHGRVGTAADVLAYQPGVFAQSTGGQDALRVSIRGSGINRGQGSFREGITFLFDGLPLTGPGGSPYELFEPLGLGYTEILRGANGFNYGGLALGGVINYVAKTGYDSSPFESRIEAGSFGYHKGQIASGQVIGNSDYYATVIGTEREGFQDLTEGHSARIIASYGYKFNDKVSNRVLLRYGATTFENPGNLTLAQLKEDPTQASPNAVRNSRNSLYKSVRVQQGSTWIGDKLTIETSPDSSLQFGAVFHDYPIDIQGTTGALSNAVLANQTPGAVFASGGIRSIWWHDDLSLSAKYETTGTLFDRTSISTVGVLSTVELIGQVKTYNDNSAARLTQNRDYAGSSNSVLFATNDLELAPKFWSTTGAQLINVKRQIEYVRVNGAVNPANLPLDYERDVVRFAPRFGLRYEFTPDTQVFGNVSHTIEPADSWKYNAIRNSSRVVQTVTEWTNLKEQQANTIEIGTRAKAGIFDGSVTLYRSWIKDELLTATDPANPSTSINTNASPTVHQGVEVGLDTTLWQEGGVDNKPASGVPAHRIHFRQAYTLNDFFYEDDNSFGGNELPGLPRSFYQGELEYEHPSGFYAGISTQLSSTYFVDYANTFKAPPYAIYGAKLGYAPPKGHWEVFLDFKNLTDKTYVTAISPSFNAGNKDTAVFQPGDGRSVFGGVSVKF